MRLFGKLVRDRIPEIIEAEGRFVATRTLSDSEYEAALLDKLDEEVLELRASGSLEEVVDVLEVLLAIAQQMGCSRVELESALDKKRATNGAFVTRTFLISAD